jgi:hypothetical protein
MKYLCLAYGDEKKLENLSAAERDELFARAMEIDKEFRQSGRVLMNEGLKWGSTTLRQRNGKLSVTDGPFIEAREQVGGVFLIEAKDLNEAIQMASRHPGARLGEDLGWAVEVRQVLDGAT